MKKYDLYIPCGSYCATAYNLKANKLRTCSYPYDWISGITLHQSLSYIQNHFEKFLIKEDMSGAGENKVFNVYKNRNNICFVHDFEKNTPFDEMFELTAQKYNRRIQRLYNNMQSASSICFVHYADNNNEQISDAVTAWKNFAQNFSDKKLELIYIKECENITSIKAEKHDNNFSLFYVAKVERTPEIWQGNIPAIKNILQNYKLTPKAYIENKGIIIAKQTKNLLFKLIAECFPTKKLRKKIRSKLNVNTHMWND